MFNLRFGLAAMMCSAGVLMAMSSIAADHQEKIPSGISVAKPDSAPSADVDSPMGRLGRASANNAYISGAPMTGFPLSFGPQAVPAAAPTSGASTGDWSIVPSPNVPGGAASNILYDVSCVSATECWAVSHYNPGNVTQTLIQKWDGTAWAVVPSPNTSATQANLLSAISCTSSSNCWAVGDYTVGPNLKQTLTLHWDGVSWKVVPSPNPHSDQNSVLFDVACVSATDCWAVGGYRAAPPAVGPDRTLMLHWDGTAWSIVPSVNGPASPYSFLTSVTCVSSSDCWAVGHYDNGVALQTLIQRWDGSSWALAISDNSNPTRDNLLTAVTCASGTDCWAVGFQAGGGAWQTLAQRWNGLTWTITATPNTTSLRHNFFYGVGCASPTECWAVGLADDGTSDRTMVQRWNGTTWTIVESPNIVPTRDNAFYGVTCVAGSGCWTVGTFSPAVALHQTLIAAWNGTAWMAINSPNVPQKKTNILSDAECTSASDCWTVGFAYKGGGNPQTLIERWEGNAWTIVDSPNASTTQAHFLRGMTCNGASDCWAVGYYIPGGAAQTLIARWNGASWSLVPSPNTSAAANNFLNEIACSSATDCFAVGYARAGTINQTLIQHWDGNAWSIVSSPNTGADRANVLSDIACTSATDCWAIGSARENGIDKSLIQRWDGNAWTITTSPMTGATDNNALSAIACPSSTECWAVGSYYTDTEFISHTLVQRWDGTSWAIVNSPNSAATEENSLYGVGCAAAGNCWAVGSHTTASGLYRTMTQEWKGTGWNIVSSPNVSATNNSFLQAVACMPAADCWALGFHDVFSGVLQTLAMRHTSGPSVALSSAVSRKTHGAAGDFDIDLPLTGDPGIECRSGGPGNDHKIVLTFPGVVTFDGATLTSGAGSIVGTSGSGTTTVTVDLTGISNAQTIAVTLSNVSDGTLTNNVAVQMGVLLGDVTPNGSVNSSDVGATKSQSGSPTTASNFRADVTANGSINSSDVGTVKAASGTSLP